MDTIQWTKKILNAYTRLKNSFSEEKEIRTGECTPEACETLDGQKGAACCKLDGACPLLSNSSCSIYAIRPWNSRVFPKNSKDLKLVKNCGYKFEPAPKP
jgi:Fe-S-cluster containining protein